MKIGTDIVQIERINTMIKKYGDKFQQRFLTPEEIDPSRRIESLSGLWAAKEAIAKAFGCGIGKELAFHDIIIAKDTKGAPFFRLDPKAFERHPYKEASLSISHDGGFAIAVVAIIF